MTQVSHSDIIIFDTETTGLIANSAIPLKQQPQIIELFALKLDGQTLEDKGEWHSLFWVKEVPEEVVKITSITTEMLRDAPKFAMMVPSLTDFFLGTRRAVGHNLSYDRDMLAIELRRLDLHYKFPWPPLHLCTVEGTENWEGFRLGLSALHEKIFGEPFDGSHRARADVQATARCLRQLVADKVIRL